MSTHLQSLPSSKSSTSNHAKAANQSWGLLVTDRTSATLVAGLRQLAEENDAVLKVIAVDDAVQLDDGTWLSVDSSFRTAPPVLFDVVTIAPSADGVEALIGNRNAVEWVTDCFQRVEVIGCSMPAIPLLLEAGMPMNAGSGLVPLDGTAHGFESFASTLDRQQRWSPSRLAS